MSISKSEEKIIQKKVNDMVEEYKANQYEAKVYELELPFAVDAIGGHHAGYKTSKPLSLKAPAKVVVIADDDDDTAKGKKRTRGDDSKPVKRARAD